MHFISSNAIPVAPPGNIGSGGDDDNPDDDDSNHKSKGKARELANDFRNLEECLRRFVLENRARSKLGPAKTYLMNVLSDISTLATVNRDISQSELNRVSCELADLEPVYEQRRKARAEACEDLDRTIDETVGSVYAFTRSELGLAISRVAEGILGVPYPGIFSAFDYAESLKAAMLSQISEAVTRSEQHARDRAVQGVGLISSLGLLHLGDEYASLTFRADIMFQRRRHMLARQVDVNIDIWDFFPVHILVQNQEKIGGTGVAMTLLTLLGRRTIGGLGRVDSVLGIVKIMGLRNTRTLNLPSLLLAAVGSVAFVLHQIPTFLPQCVSSKLSRAMI